MKAKEVLLVCRKCKAKCCKIGGSDFTESEMRTVLKAGHKNFFDKVEKNHYELKSKMGRCSYLTKELSCGIHKVRPLMCRCWPVYPEYKKNKKQYVVIQCPLTPYLSKKNLEIMKKQASKLPRNLSGDIKTNLPKKDLDLIIKRFNKFFKTKRLR